MIFHGSLVFHWTAPGLVIGSTAMVLAAALGYIAWRRSGYARRVGLLEILRLTLVMLVAVTLNQPEWMETFRPTGKPTLLVLVDRSSSMETRDLPDESRPAAPPRSRREVADLFADPARWQSQADRLNVVFESFSSSLDPPEQATDLHGALLGALNRHDRLRGIVLLSDGDWNVGDPPGRAASRLRMRQVPVFAVATGSANRLPDLRIERFDVPSFGTVGKPIRIPFAIESALPQDHRVSITLETTSGATIQRTVTIPAMGKLEDSFLWTPEQIGDETMTLIVPVHDSETVTDNNRQVAPLAVRQETLQVLLIESVPRWEYRYLHNALVRDPGVEVSCLLFRPEMGRPGGGKDYLDGFPTSLEQLSRYDVVFLGDVGIEPGQLTTAQAKQLKGLVQNQASGLILMPGLRAGHRSLVTSDLESLYPVVLDATQPRGWGSRIPWQFELTETGRLSLLTKLEDNEDDNARVWRTLPGFQWYAPVLRAKAGSEVLATHKTETNRYGRIPLIVTRTFGTGKVLFMGTDAAWRSREGIEDKYHYRFWGQVARWMAYQRHLAGGERMRLFYSPDRPQTRGTVRLNANVMGDSGDPLQAGHVSVRVTAPSGKTDLVQLAAQDSEWGLFSSSFTPQEQGQYTLTLNCRENQSSLETTLSVQGMDREQWGQPARIDVLEEIALITRGELVNTDSLDSLRKRITQLPEPQPLVRRRRLWCHPLWVALLVALLAIFWTGRKMIGTV